MSDDRDFDPRFDPAYQRGYEGVVDAAPRSNRPAATPAAPAVVPEPIGAPPASATPQPDEVLHTQVDDFVEAAPSRPNPFLIALIVLSVALVGGGLYLVVKMRDLFADTQSSTNFDFVTLQVLIGAAPIAIGLGVATALGVLFIYAVRWGRVDR